MIPGALGLEAEPKWGNGSAPREGVQGVQGWVGQMLSKNVTSAEDKLRSDPTGALQDSNYTSELVPPLGEQAQLLYTCYSLKPAIGKEVYT